MNNKLSKIIATLFILVLILLGIAINDNFDDVSVGDAQIDNDELLQVHFLDVGQGDSIYIRTPDEVDILIDGGPDKNVLSELGKVMPFWDREIDVMILTHPHSDHVSGLVEVLRRFDVKQIYYTGVLHTAPDYLAWLDEIKKQGLDLKIVNEKFTLDLGEEIDLDFLWPLEDFTNKKVDNLNNTSIVNLLRYKDTQMLFTGDAEIEVEEALLEEEIDLAADLLKAGHHGSTTASSEEFLASVKPETVVIQCGQDNSFGHPHLRIIKRLQRLGIEIFRTDNDGMISVYSDGKQIALTR
jgi:competence protein ComEC